MENEPLLSRSELWALGEKIKRATTNPDMIIYIQDVERRLRRGSKAKFDKKAWMRKYMKDRRAKKRAERAAQQENTGRPL